MSLVTFSTEIIDAIISFFPVDDNGDLKRESLVPLARVHSSLLAPSQRHIFRKISLGTTYYSLTKAGPQKREHRQSRQKFKKRLAALRSSPHLIGYIKDLTLGPLILQEYSYSENTSYYGFDGCKKGFWDCYWPLEYDVKELIKLFDKNRSQVTKLTSQGAKPTPCDWRDVQQIAVSWLREVLLPTTQEFKIMYVAALLEKAHDLTRKASGHTLDSVWIKALEEFAKEMYLYSLSIRKLLKMSHSTRSLITLQGGLKSTSPSPTTLQHYIIKHISE
ncbi:hypothetical protein DL96DRAFT_1740427 [Flagelloscypha sp. PMI_526]|nr:hypothetical protein DL96DRAFT_1740427 [Flagelloscypha sp. PMI_526]